MGVADGWVELRRDKERSLFITQSSEENGSQSGKSQQKQIHSLPVCLTAAPEGSRAILPLG